MMLRFDLVAETSIGLDTLLNPFSLYTLPVDEWITTGISWLVDNFRPLFQVIQLPISWVLKGMEGVLVSTPPIILLVMMSLIAWQLAGRRVAIYSLWALTLIGFMGAWQPAMVSLALVVTAVVFCLLLGLPLGIACARSDRLNQVVRPLLDAMQTLPTFVYLVPVVMLFGIGEVPGAG